MKPNDKAIEAALDAAAAQFPPSEDYAELVKELREDVLQFNLKDTAYENIANEAADALEAVLAERDELDKWLRESKQNFMRVDIERNNLRAERDALKDLLPNQSHEGRAPIPTDWWSVAVLERRKRRAAEKERDALKAERDALLARNKRLQETLSYWNDTYKYSPANEQPPILEDAARLAPVDEEALVDVAVKKALFVISSAHGNELERWLSAMRAAIAAAIRSGK